jgi:hypothetical protein
LFIWRRYELEGNPWYEHGRGCEVDEMFGLLHKTLYVIAEERLLCGNWRSGSWNFNREMKTKIQK